MKKNTEKNVRICGYCHKELPIEAFYISKHTHHADNYCKECRKAMTSKQYQECKFVDISRDYPVITQIPDRERRMVLILKALQTVNKSIARKRQRMLNESCRQDKAAKEQAD
ncbi:hypothetical protein [Bacteroides sp.]|uniref:hypothetical protein n=1 Tax=Bacteroides sp. TaxID=29523 RepID=UPI0026303389|nr:hypothetical protein [Bacteroides sp.]